MLVRFLLLISLSLSSSLACAIHILAINTEQTEGQKAVTGVTQNAVAPATASPDEINAYKTLVLSSKADIVGLTESPSKRVAEQLIAALGPKWQLVSREDRNSSTGLRVNILSRLKLKEGSISNLADQFGYSRHEKHRAKPDAVISAGFELDDKSYFVVVSYLTAGKGDYADVRYAQADAVRSALFKHCKDSYDHCVVMGNMNDEPGSQAVKRIQGVDGMFGDKVALHQAELPQGSGSMSTFGEGKNATQGDQIMSTLQGAASLHSLAPSITPHKAVLLVSRDPFEAEKPSKKIKRDRAKMAAYYKLQHLQELVEKQKTYIETLEIENANLLQRASNSH